jgi:hypothetical protein
VRTDIDGFGLLTGIPRVVLGSVLEVGILEAHAAQNVRKAGGVEDAGIGSGCDDLYFYSIEQMNKVASVTTLTTRATSPSTSDLSLFLFMAVTAVTPSSSQCLLSFLYPF